jgi:hypothetical protein
MSSSSLWISPLKIPIMGSLLARKKEMVISRMSHAAHVGVVLSIMFNRKTAGDLDNSSELFPSLEIAKKHP